MSNFLWFLCNETKLASSSGLISTGENNFILDLFINLSFNIFFEFFDYSDYFIEKKDINTEDMDLTPEFLKSPENYEEDPLEKKIRRNRRLFYPFQDEKTLKSWKEEYTKKIYL